MKKLEKEKLEFLFSEKKFTKESHKTLYYLQEIQNEFGYLSYEHMNYLAEFLNIHNSQIESIVSFYKFFNLENVKYTIRICHTISCDLKNKDRITYRIKSDTRYFIDCPQEDRVEAKTLEEVSSIIGATHTEYISRALSKNNVYEYKQYRVRRIVIPPLKSLLKELQVLL